MSDAVPFGGPAPQRGRDGTLTALIETLLDRGLVLDADITVSVGGVELLGIKIRAALASFDTAARYGLDFPTGTDRSNPAWRAALEPKESCPQCGKVSPRDQLLDASCPWCGWRSARALASVPREAEEPERAPDEGDHDVLGEEEPTGRAAEEPVRRRRD
jgi:hypothetical protein